MGSEMCIRDSPTRSLRTSPPLASHASRATGLTVFFIWHGETVRPCNRGRLGIVIILSPVARLAWEARGELVRKDREGRVMMVDFALEGQRMLRLGSAYSPTTGASSDERLAFYDEMTRCSAGGGPRVILAIGLDGNASIGVGKWGDKRTPGRRPGRPVGPQGLRHQNGAGRELLAHVSVQSLCLTASFSRIDTARHGFTHVISSRIVWTTGSYGSPTMAE